MPVKRFRDISQMKAPVYEPGSAQLYEVIRHVWGLSDQIFPLRFPAGVFKHRSIEDAEALRARWEAANFQAHRKHIEATRPRTGDHRVDVAELTMVWGDKTGAKAVLREEAQQRYLELPISDRLRIALSMVVRRAK